MTSDILAAPLLCRGVQHDKDLGPDTSLQPCSRSIHLTGCLHCTMESSATAASAAAAAARRRQQRRVPNEKRKRAANALVFAYQESVWRVDADMKDMKMCSVQSPKKQMYTTGARRLSALSYECVVVRVFWVGRFSGVHLSTTKLM